MRSRLRLCRLARWLTLTACTLTITGSLFSCSISANAGHPGPPARPFEDAVTAPWG
jgi:hypothetical protein